MSPRSTLSKSSWLTANTSTRNLARLPLSAPRRSTKSPANAAWVGTSTHERPSTRAFDARSHRGCDHDGVPDGLHSDGPRNILRVHCLLRSDPSLHRQHGLRVDGPA